MVWLLENRTEEAQGGSLKNMLPPATQGARVPLYLHFWAQSDDPSALAALTVHVRLEAANSGRLTQPQTSNMQKRDSSCL